MSYQNPQLHHKYLEAREAGVDIQWKDVEDCIEALFQQWPGMSGLDAEIETHMWIDAKITVARHQQHERSLKNEQH